MAVHIRKVFLQQAFGALALAALLRDLGRIRFDLFEHPDRARLAVETDRCQDAAVQALRELGRAVKAGRLADLVLPVVACSVQDSLLSDAARAARHTASIRTGCGASRARPGHLFSTTRTHPQSAASHS